MLLFFSFYYSKCTYGWSERESESADIHIQRGSSSMKSLCLSALFCLFARLVPVTSGHRIILVSPRFCTFASLIPGHLKASNHLSLSLLLYFREFWTSQASTSQPWAVWRQVRTQGDVTFCSCLQPYFSLLCSSLLVI